MYKKTIGIFLLFILLIITGCSNDITQNTEQGDLLITLSKDQIDTNSINSLNKTTLHRTKEKILNNLCGYRIRITNSDGLKVFKDIVFKEGQDTITFKLSLPANSGYNISALAMIGNGRDSDGEGVVDNYKNPTNVFVGGYGDVEGVVISADESNSVNIKMSAIQYDISEHPSEVTTGEVYNLSTSIKGISDEIKLAFPGIFTSNNSNDIDPFENRIYGSYNNGNIIVENITAPGETKTMYYGIRGRLEKFKYNSDNALFNEYPFIIYPSTFINESPLELKITDTNANSIDIGFTW